MTRFVRVSLAGLSLVLATACSSAGSGSGEASAEAKADIAVNGELGTDVFVEEHDEGSVAWRIEPDGQVKAAVLSSAGARISQDVTGSLVYKVEGGGEAKTVPLAVDAKTGLLVAAGPKLEADLTEVSYTLSVSGKPWSGVILVPVGGTAALAASGKATAEAKIPDEVVGPHGGTIQIVGGERLEMVADANTRETRVYVLDAELRPVKVEARTLRMGFVAQANTFVNFAPDPAGLFFVATVGAAVINPLRVTVALGVGGVTHAAIWGYRPGVRIYAPSVTVKLATAPRVRFVLQGGFDGGVDVYGRAHTKVALVGADDDRDGDRKKGNNGRHVGQDGTWDRDSGGSKDDGRDDPRGGKAKGADHGDDSKGGGSSKSSAKGGGNDSKGGGNDSKSSAKGGGNDSKGGGSSAKSSGGGNSGSSKGGGGGGKSSGGGKGKK